MILNARPQPPSGFTQGIVSASIIQNSGACRRPSIAMNQRGVVIGLLLGVLLNTSELIAGQGVDEARLARVGVLVREAIDAEQLPGAVVLVGRGDEVV